VAGWLEVVIEVGRERAEQWADALLEAGALSVQAEDADADSPDEQPQYGEPGTPGPGPGQGVPAPIGWARTRLSALCDAPADAGRLLASAAAAMAEPAPRLLASRPVADRDWVRATQSQFEPIPVGERLIITPTWHLDALGDAAGRIPIVLDPGLAFGTGSHPTTLMCLQWLERHLRPGSTVIDYGCGSGILAIAAARLGASRVTGIDIDPQALASTRDNAARNGVAVQVLGTDAPRPDAADVVVANILSSPLKVLAPVLTALVKPGGSLVLSGVLQRQADEVAAAYTGHVPLSVAATLDGWACLAGTKPR